jgi:hypothetical protein
MQKVTVCIGFDSELGVLIMEEMGEERTLCARLIH